MKNEQKSVPDVLKELWELLVSYGKQETIDPLKQLGRFVGFGLPAMICLGIGMSLLFLGGLRVLQTETGSSLTGNLSWIPYLAVSAAALIVIGLSVWAIVKKQGSKA